MFGHELCLIVEFVKTCSRCQSGNRCLSLFIKFASVGPPNCCSLISKDWTEQRSIFPFPARNGPGCQLTYLKISAQCFIVWRFSTYSPVLQWHSQTAAISHWISKQHVTELHLQKVQISMKPQSVFPFNVSRRCNSICTPEILAQVCLFFPSADWNQSKVFRKHRAARTQKNKH